MFSFSDDAVLLLDFIAVELVGVFSQSFIGVVNTSLGSLAGLSNGLPDLVIRLPEFDGSDMRADYKT